MFRKLLLSLALLVCLSSPSWAINCAVANGTCFWIGGTGTMDFATDSAHWSNTTGGATCSCEPIASNILTFDASSGAGTVTFGATIIATAITQSSSSVALLNPATGGGPFAVTLSGNTGYTCTSGTSGGLTMGAAVWKLTGNNGVTWNVTGTCLSAGIFTSTGSTIELASTSANSGVQFRGNGLTYNNLQLDSNTVGVVYTFNAGNATFAAITANLPTTLSIGSVTVSASSIVTVGGGAGSYLALEGLNNCTTCILALSNPSTISNAGIFQLKVTGSTLTANSSYDLGGNTGAITINAPTPIGGGFIIGGG